MCSKMVDYNRNGCWRSVLEDNKRMLLQSVFKTKNELIMLYPPEKYQSNPGALQRRFYLIHMIELVITDMCRMIKNGEPPKILIRNTRTWDNCDFDEILTLKPVEEAVMTEINFGDKRSRYKYSLIIFVLAKIHKLLSTNTTCTKRELFYQNVDRVHTQDQIDNVLNDITCLLNTPMYDLNVYCTSKGLVYGSVEIIMDDKRINCLNAGGTIIPSNVCKVTDIKSDAKFILVIEKDAIFQKLIEENISDKLGSCILITGKGFPDVNTRYLLSKMWNILCIPIFGLVDPDPWGIEIMCVYRFGSLNLSHQSRQLAVPSLRWIGIHPSELSQVYNEHHREELTDKDRSKLYDILKRGYTKSEPLITKEIEVLLDKNYKAEIEGVEKAPGFLINVYLRLKITSSEYL